MTEVFKETNNEVDVYTTKYFAKAMQNQNLDSLIYNLGAEAPTIEGKKKAPAKEEPDDKMKPATSATIATSATNATGAPSATIACEICTMLNEVGRTVCDICGMPLRTSNTNITSANIACGACTYLFNEAGSTVCEMCG